MGFAGSVCVCVFGELATVRVWSESQLRESEQIWSVTVPMSGGRCLGDCLFALLSDLLGGADSCAFSRKKNKTNVIWLLSGAHRLLLAAFFLMNYWCFNHSCCFCAFCLYYRLMIICILCIYCIMKKNCKVSLSKKKKTTLMYSVSVCVFTVLKIFFCCVFCTAHFYVCESWVSTPHFCVQIERAWYKGLAPICVGRSFSTEVQPIHLWTTNHRHQILLHHHQCGVAQRSPLYVWHPRVVPHRASTLHTIHSNLTCFLQGEFLVLFCFYSKGGVGGRGWTSRMGWERVGRAGVVPLPALFLLSLPSSLILFSYLCLN